MRLTVAQARRRLGAAPVARLATVSSADSTARPHIVPVTFAVDGGRIFSAVDAKPKTTRHLKRLRNIQANPWVAVLADHYAADWALLWWVRADGRADILDDPAGMAAPLRLLAQRYPQYVDNPPAGPVISILVERWTGWAASPGG
ncbi:MAG TPA: TIGR03668 family PPOX class F420-dependent oxidoreductase [Streptosporangiaceae bacterium]|nr:TIGR03668 family PPOX class F420-dependent oxidoreductase [Streptosporangiaceae bacterium]